MDCSLPGSSLHGISQARILEWVTISLSRVSSPPRGQTGISCVSCIVRLILYHRAPKKPTGCLMTSSVMFLTPWKSQWFHLVEESLSPCPLIIISADYFLDVSGFILLTARALSTSTGDLFLSIHFPCHIALSIVCVCMLSHFCPA